MSKAKLAAMCALAVASTSLAAGADELVAPRLTLDPLALSPSVLTLDAAATAPAPQKSAIDQIKQPVDWFKWGADERLRIEYFDNAITLNQQAPGHEWDFFRYRTRVWATISPCAEFSVYTRVLWEGRHWQNPVQNDPPNDTAFSKPEWDWGQFEFDNLYAKLNLAPLNTAVTVGRQDIILGDGWLVLEGTPLDGSTTIYFDAVRSSTQLKDYQTTVDMIYINNWSSPDMWLPTFPDNDRAMIENNERGAILWVTNKSVKNLELDPYFIYKHDEAAFPMTKGGDNADIYTFGARAVYDFNANLRGRVEAAGQFGSKNGASLCALGVNSRVSYFFNDSLKNELRLNVEYLSGDNPGTATNEAFDPLWGRWPQFSELYVYSYAPETRIANTTNLFRIGPGYVVHPTSNTEFEFDYNALFAPQNTLAGHAGFTDTGNFRGQLFSAIFRVKFNQFVSGHIWSEYLVPGNYYDDTRRDNAVYLRGEIFLTF
jgi:hypothetical protein